MTTKSFNLSASHKTFVYYPTHDRKKPHEPKLQKQLPKKVFVLHQPFIERNCMWFDSFYTKYLSFCVTKKLNHEPLLVHINAKTRQPPLQCPVLDSRLLVVIRVFVDSFVFQNLSTSTYPAPLFDSPTPFTTLLM